MLKSAVLFQLFISPLFLPVWASRVSVVKKLGDKEVVDLNRRFANASLTEVLHWATDQFAGHVAQLTSFGVTGLVVADMLQREKLLNAVPQVTIDTLHLFPETESFISEWQQEHPNATVKVFRPMHASNRTAFSENYGPNLRAADPTLFGYVSKLEPMRRALGEMHVKCWFTGRRQSQGGERANLQIVERDPEDDTRIKVNPLAMWSWDDVMGYLRKNKVHYNPLIDRGYKSIGDVETSSVARVGEGERQGRWRGSSQTECGMHVSETDASIEELSSAEESIRAGYTWETKARVRADKVGVKTCDEATLSTCVKDGALVLVFAPWCPHCQLFEPQYNVLAKRIHDDLPNMSVVRLDGWENKPKGFDFDSFPTVFLVQNNGTKVVAPDDFHEMKIKDEMAWILAQRAPKVALQKKPHAGFLQQTSVVDADYHA